MVQVAGGTTLVREGDRAGELHEPMRGTAVEPAASGRRDSRGPGEDRRYSWLDSYFARLDGKEARREYYARLE